MIDALYRLLAGKYADDPRRARGRCGAAVGVIGIFANMLLFVVKFIAGALVGSIAVQADGINNLSDAGSSVISLISFKISEKPADRDHPFGHARIEYVASMIVSFIIMLIGFELLRESINKILHPTETTVFSYVSVIVLSVSVLVKLLLGLVNRGIGKKINSEVVKATATDCFSDALATGAVLVSTFVMKFSGFDTDGYMGVIVAVIIMIAGIKILAETKDHILGDAPDEDTVKAIREIISRYPEALGVHDMYIHNYGVGHAIASFHVEVNGAEDIYHTHDVIDNMEKQIAAELSIICTIHMDPIVTDDERTSALRSAVIEKIKEIDDRLNIHDFRFVEGDTHTNLIFDIVAPFELKLENKKVIELAEQKVREISNTYFCVICIDRE